jgi:hypothetical protein
MTQGTGPSETPVTMEQSKWDHIPEYRNRAVRAQLKI